MIKDITLLRFVDFADLNLWDVKRYKAGKLKSDFEIVLLGKYINEETTKLKPQDYPNQEFKILGVNNKTGIFDAYTQPTNEIKQAYKKMEIGFIAYNPYRVNVGSIGMRTKEHKNNLISPAYVVFSCKPELNPDYLYKLFKTKKYNQIIRDNTTGSVRQNLTFDLLEKIKIPLPPLDKQEQILKDYYKKINLADKWEEKAKELDGYIDEYLFDELGINILDKSKRDNNLSFVNFKDIDRWGVNFLMNSKSASQLLLSKKYTNYPLTNFVIVNPSTSFSNLKINKLSFLPMECISDDYGEVIENYEGNIENSDGYTKFKEGDLLWSKITPCMENGKSAIVNNLINGYGYGSTEYHVLRKKSNNINLEFVYHILRTKYIRKQGTYHFTGSAGQQRVPSEFLEKMWIPVPNITIQNRIADKITRIKNLIKKLQQNAENYRVKAIEDFEKAVIKE